MEVLRGDFQDKDGDDPLVWVGEESSLSGSDVALLCRNSLGLCRWWTMAPPSECVLESMLFLGALRLASSCDWLGSQRSPQVLKSKDLLNGCVISLATQFFHQFNSF